MKRMFDFTIALMLLLLAAVPMLIIATAIRLTSRGPAIHWSERVGKNNVIFKMPKFRTLRLGAPDVATHLMKDVETYLTPFGDFLRTTSLDELPQLWSVLKGDMSLVGPRPHEPHEVAKYQKSHRKLLNIKPGITGMAQVSGRSDLSWEEEVRLDTLYIEDWSPWLDLIILLKTPWIVLRRKGAK